MARLAVGLLALVCGLMTANAGKPSNDSSRRPLRDRGQVRVDRNDRGTYQPTVVEAPMIRPDDADRDHGDNRQRSQRSEQRSAPSAMPLRDVRQVNYDNVVANDESVPVGNVISENYIDVHDSYSTSTSGDAYGTDYPGCGCETGCDDFGCDAFGCDSMGCDGGGCGGSCTASTMQFRGGERIQFCRDRWFGSLEALLWWRDGDRLPSLVTTGSAADQDTAGELGDPATTTLFGGGNTLNDLGVGGRATIGTWLDDSQCRSLVLRAWYGGNTDDGFTANSDDFAVLARPFTSFTGTDNGVPNTQLVNFPSIAQGTLAADLESDVYGGDISVRKAWRQGFLGSIDTLYGYQYMRLDEKLSIRSTTLSTDTTSTVFSSVIDLTDAFDISNEFHGGQVGLAGRLDDGCWSVNWLAKVGFGAVRRRANLTGFTTTSLGAATAVDDQGLLVRDSNSGVTEDTTFGWVPELGVGLAYRRFPNYDLSVGYSIVAMTDAIRVSSAIDDELGTNLSTDGSGSNRPLVTLDDSTFYIQGIHFGIAKVY